MRKNRVFLISIVVFLAILVFFVFSKYREPISDERKEVVNYFLKSTPSPLTDQDRINYIKKMNIYYDERYRDILKNKDTDNETKVKNLKELVKNDK